MKTEDKIYSVLCVLFSVLIVVGNLIYQKFVFLPIFTFYSFELSAGAVLYPITFFIMDLIAEFYGKERASFCVKVAISMNIVVALVIILMSSMEATEWSKIDNMTFNKVFGQYSIAFLGSILAFYIAQTTDIWIYLRIRKLTKGKLIWLRNNVSTALSLLIDTTIVIIFMTFFGVLPAGYMWILIFNSYLFKLFFIICCTPLFYLCIYAIRFITKL
jgi:queuosine precursor transporter